MNILSKRCGFNKDDCVLHAHHIISLDVIIKHYNIKCRKDAEKYFYLKM